MSDDDKRRDQLIEHLYGLLDEADARDLEAYLASPEGAELKARGEAWKANLRRASRLEVPVSPFLPPAPEPVRPATPKADPDSIKHVWTRWAVAACLMVVVGGLGGPAAYQVVGWTIATRQADSLKVAAFQRRDDLQAAEYQATVAEKARRDEVKVADAAKRAADEGHLKALQTAKADIDSKNFVVRLVGPDRIQPGAPNEWKVETLTPRGAYASPKRVEMVVRDQNDQELLRESHDQTHGSSPLKLTVAFWEKVKPGSELFLEVVALADDDRRSVLAERLPLARPVYVTHLVTDKPLYRPGETIRYRALTLDRSTFLPPTHDQRLEFRLRDPAGAMMPGEEGNGRVMANGQVVNGPDGKPLRGLCVGEFPLAPDAPGGEWTLEIVERREKSEVVLERKKFLVNTYVPEVFEKKLEFDASRYGPGQTVRARFEASRTAGMALTGATVNVTAGVPGRPPFHVAANAKLTIVTDPATRQTRAFHDIAFKLPPDLWPKSGAVNATLAVSINDGADNEVIVRPIPLVSKELKVEFFPEGGDLIAGVPGRVYFQVRTPDGKPADLRGKIMLDGKPIADVATMTDAANPGVNRGQGVFTLQPAAGKKYFLKLESPTAIDPPTPDGFPLPEVKADGVALRSLDTVTAKGSAIRVQVQVGQGTKVLHIGAYARGRLIGHHRVEAAAGKAVDVSLTGSDTAGGVTRVTVFEELPAKEGKVTLVPRAERLVFRQATEQLILNVQADKPRYSPGGKVELELSATNEKEQPAPAVLLVGVVNQSVIAMADDKTERLMPTHFLLAGEVRHPSELENADFLLTDHPQAAVALDALLGTQGWRRFAEQRVPGAKEDQADVVKMLVAHGQQSTAPVGLYDLEKKRLDAEFLPKREQANGRLTQAVAARDRFDREEAPTLKHRVDIAKVEKEVADKAHRDAAANVYGYETRGEKVRSMALPLFFGGLVVIAVAGVLLAWRSSGADRRRLIFAVGGSAATALLVVAGILLTQPTKEAATAHFALLQEYANPRYAPGGTRNGELPVGIPPNPKGVEGPVMPVVEPQPPDVKKDEPPPVRLDPKTQPKPTPRAIRDPKAPGAAKVPGFEMNAMAADDVQVFEPLPGELPPTVVREYAHQRDPNLGAIRSDFAETVYWHPVLVLPESGKARVSFQLGDDIARYRILVAGHTVDGRIGAITQVIEARKPFSLDPKLPAEVAHTDTIDVPIRAINDSDDRRAVTFTLTPGNLSVEGPGLKTPDGLLKDTLDLAPNGRGRKVYRLKPTVVDGPASLGVVGSSDPAEADAIRRTMKVVPDGFPAVATLSDLLERKAVGKLTLPKDIVPGSLTLRLEVYPSTLAELVQGIDAMLREPSGCFEQTSSSNYPNALVLDYLNSTKQGDPEVSRRARELLDRGQAKLVAFETLDTPAKTKHGFDWFGSPDMAHEALTAYGLLQFKDMARVHPVDPALIKRTQDFLLSRRDGKGGFQRNPRNLDRFGGAPPLTTDAYIVWALVESDPDDAEKLDLKTEIAALKKNALDAETGKESYVVALASNVLLQRGDRESAMTLLDRLASRSKDGAITGGATSITRSGGRDLEIETTALTLLALMRANDPKHTPAVRQSIQWLVKQRGGFGGYGSTQSTILALKALTTHARKESRPAEDGEVSVSVAGKVVGTRKFTVEDREVIALDLPIDGFAAGGTFDVEVTTTAKQPYPFTLRAAYTSLTPVGGEKCVVRLETSLGKILANEGETVPLSVALSNKGGTGQGMAVAIVGIPAGLRVPTDMKQLIDLREKGVISFFEVRGRELVLYWRELAPEQRIELGVDLVCDVPGEYRGPASRAYLYYDADHKHWVSPLAVRIKPAGDPAEKVAGR